MTPSPDAALAVAQVLAGSLTQSGKSIFDLSASSRVLLVFLRHAGCTFCREALHDLSHVRTRIEDGGTRIVLVHMGDTEALETLLIKYGLTGIDRISDPNQTLYQAFGVRRGTFSQLLGPKVIWRGISAIRHGLSAPRADAMQMPALFLIGNSTIVRRFRHRTAADRPDYLSFCRDKTDFNADKKAGINFSET